ncbi:uncharacterized protein ARMOST_21143 [Armillaria ostoyae]|uniref:Uncharacterized protein n=1 Tax=Armillaria ostoyae TaxID=47428 RepID=A0A284S9B5_ARMOS|nr:uncharacterized protein ARMOST_21143 [Armillaria ostoyae]
MDDADSDFDEDDGGWTSKLHPATVSFPPGSSPRTASAVDDIDPPAEETTAEPLDGPLSPLSYGERIYETEVEEAECFGSIWHIDAAALAQVDVSLHCEGRAFIVDAE